MKASWKVYGDNAFDRIAIILLLVIVTAAFLIGCSSEQPSISERADRAVADTAVRALVLKRIAQEPALREAMLQRMAEQMNVDTTVSGQVCSMMITRARRDTTLAEHMCSVVSSDTLFRRILERKYEFGPTRALVPRTAVRSDNTRVGRTK